MLEQLSLTGNKNYPLLMRSNNPGGVLISENPWPGKKTKKGARTYEEFETYHHGILAMLRICQKYYFEQRANTIEKLVYRYAKPGTEVTPFIESVSTGSGFRPRHVIPWRRESVYLVICEMCRYMNRGRNPIIHPDMFALVWLKIDL